MTNMRTYEEERKDFNWGISEKELGYKPGRRHQHRLLLQRPHLQPGQGRTSWP